LQFVRAVSVSVLDQESLGDLVGKIDALLQQFGLNFLHVESVVVDFDRVAVETQFVVFLVDC